MHHLSHPSSPLLNSSLPPSHHPTLPNSISYFWWSPPPPSPPFASPSKFYSFTLSSIANPPQFRLRFFLSVLRSLPPSFLLFVHHRVDATSNQIYVQFSISRKYSTHRKPQNSHLHIIHCWVCPPSPRQVMIRSFIGHFPRANRCSSSEFDVLMLISSADLPFFFDIPIGQNRRRFLMGKGYGACGLVIVIHSFINAFLYSNRMSDFYTIIVKFRSLSPISFCFGKFRSPFLPLSMVFHLLSPPRLSFDHHLSLPFRDAAFPSCTGQSNPNELTLLISPLFAPCGVGMGGGRD